MKSPATDGVITLRRYRAGDGPALYTAVQGSFAQLHRWLPWCHAGYSPADSEEFVRSRDAEWEKGEHFSFVITDTAENEFLGGVGLNSRNRIHNFANLGYWIRADASGRGLATRAAQLMARFGFEEVGLQRIEIVCAPGNLASQRVAEKAGARREGVLRSRMLLHGQPGDAVIFSLVPKDLDR
jgi:RimJ/RimL family protein N-acetyltransferase